MKNEYYNAPEYITETLNGGHAQSELRKLWLGINYSMRTLLVGRKWLVYFALTMFPIAASLFSVDKYLGANTATEAFVRNFRGTIVSFLFTFGALLISLPHTADEISDNIMESYVVRPTRRDTIYTSRWIVSIIGIWVINSIVLIVYYLYFHIAGGDFTASNFFDNLKYLFYAIYILFFSALMYGSVFTFVGMIGNRGFTFGILIAMFETFLINFVFLANNKYIPRTNIEHLANDLMGNLYDYTSAPASMDTTFNYIYFIAFTIVTLILGLYYFRNKQFEG
jgi:ABC-type transport system involved in multi-copper enzyme maturation permease subunit